MNDILHLLVTSGILIPFYQEDLQVKCKVHESQSKITRENVRFVLLYVANYLYIEKIKTGYFYIIESISVILSPQSDNTFIL